ncbi:MAG TPA: nickel-type superoxide dismutase maturation protease [Acidimicrobiales bacterium]|nr:nickel-type superoxide dismutase maturation protease [Acidimicrobiales bacterium]
MERFRVAVAAGAAVAVAVAWRSLRRVEVDGASMIPALLPGDRLVVVGRPWPPPRWPRPGEVIAVRDPREPSRVLIKRVVAVDRPRGTLEVVGDAPDASTDSRQFGPVPRASVVGRAVYRYAPVGRSGPGPWPGSTIGPDAKPQG